MKVFEKIYLFCKNPRLAVFVLVLLALISYSNSFPGAFILDDHTAVETNPLVAKIDLLKIFTTDYWGEFANSGLYRPLTILSFGLNRLMFGNGPASYHLINLLLHVFIVVLLYVLLPRLGISLRSAWLAAALFAVHPIHTEVLNEAVGRSELLVAFFLLLAVGISRWWSERPGLRNLAVAIVYAAALLSKEHGVVLLALLPLLDYAQGLWRNSGWRRHISLYLLLLGETLFWVFWRDFGVARVAGRFVVEPEVNLLQYLDFWPRIITALQIQGLYLGKLLWPASLHGVYSGSGWMSPVSPLASIAILGGALLALVVVLWGCFKKQQMAWLAAAYLVCFAPTSNLLLVVGVGMAERLAYLPSIWFCALMALVLSRLIRSPLAYWGVVVVLLGGLLTTTLWRNRDFASEISLWQADVERDPQNVLAWLALSNSYQTAGRVEEGENYLRNKLVQVPDLAQAQSVYADILLSQERYAEALDYALRAEADPATDMVINKFILARAYLGIGRYAESLLWLEKSRSMYGPYGTFWAIQGMALEGLGRDQEAIASYRQVVDMPLGSDVPGRLAGLLMKQRDYAGAEASYREALRRQPSAANWNALAVALALQGKTTAAVAAFKQAVALNPGEPSYRENLLRAQDEDADGSRAQKP